MEPPVTRLVAHDKSHKCTSWGYHGTHGLYIGPSLDHCIFIQCYTPETGIIRITDTLQYIPK